MLEEQARQELFETVTTFHACKQEDGQSVNSYLLKMKIYLDTLKCLGFAMPNELGVSLILNSLNKDYNQFIQNYNMHSMGKAIAELHAMLKLHEKGIPKKSENLVVLTIWEYMIHKDKKKPLGEKGYGYCKNHKKTGQKRTRERKEYARAGNYQEKSTLDDDVRNDVKGMAPWQSPTILLVERSCKAINGQMM
nr:zinc finger, CCHC-type [Tanacetum cinerariifolium]